MSEGAISIKKAVPIIVITWILSLATTLAIAYFTPFTPIGTSQIDDSAVTADKIVNDAIITTKLADGSVTSAKILDATITAEDIASGSIITVKVADGAITTAKIADGSVTAAKIADSAIVTVKLANETVTSEKIADGNVTATDLAANAVTTSKIVDEAVVTVKLADGSVTSAKILDGTIAAADLATNAVTSIKIANGAVTTSKIADYAVTNLKLAAGAIPYNVTYSTGWDTTSSTSFVDMPDMSVDISLTRNSTLIIMVSAETWLSGTGTPYIYWRAMVNTTQAYPVSSALIITESTDYNSHSYTFYRPDVVAGFYTVKIQWKVWRATTTGTVNERTLIVFALPA